MPQNDDIQRGNDMMRKKLRRKYIQQGRKMHV